VGKATVLKCFLAHEGVGHPCSIISRIAASSLMVFSMNAIFGMFVRPPQLLKNGAFDGGREIQPDQCAAATGIIRRMPARNLSI
jgi:hypothetical protein